MSLRHPVYVKRLIHICATRKSCICATWLASCICICMTWLVHICDMTRSYVWHDSCICATWLVHICAVSHSYMCIPVAARLGSATTKRTYNCTSAMLKSGACVTYDSLIHVWEDTCFYVRRDSFVYVRQDSCVHLHLSYAKVGCLWDTRHIHTCATWLNHICATWLNHTGMTWLIHICVIWLIRICATWLIHICATWLIHIHATWLIHICATWLMHICATWLMRTIAHGAMGWLRLVGSIKLQVSFAEYRLFSRALLQKRPII